MKKILLIGLLLCSYVAVTAQLRTMYNSLGTNLTTDTCTNAGVATVTSRIIPGGGSAVTTINLTLTKISGTVAGTITIQGSMDGTVWKALNTPNTQTALATATATDVASNTFHWILSGNPFPYYRASWTGSGTMAATIAGVVLRH